MLEPRNAPSKIKTSACPRESGIKKRGVEPFIALSGVERAEFLAEIERLTTSWAAIKSSRQSDAKWCQPRLTVRVKHLAGVKTLRHGVSAIARRLRSAALLSSAMGSRPLSEDATRPTKVEQFHLLLSAHVEADNSRYVAGPYCGD
jgi:hypothetical protein